MEHPKRSLIKALTWRIVGIVTTMAVVYVYSRDLKESFNISISANLIKFFLHYIHERLWNKVRFGRAKQPEYQI